MVERDPVGGQARRSRRAVVLRGDAAVGGAERQEDVAREAVAVRSQPRETQTGALRQRGEMGRQHGRVGGDDHDDRTAAGGPRVLGQLHAGDDRGVQHLADRRAVDDERVAPRVVGLHQRAKGVALALDLEDPRRRAGAALEVVADHAGAAADVALGHRPALGGGQRREHVLGAHVLAADVVQAAVPGLGHEREAVVAALLVLAQRLAHLDLALDEGVAHDAEAVRVGQGDRRREQTALAYVLEAREVARSVERVRAREQRLDGDLAVVRDDDGDARADRALAASQRPGVALDQGGDADPHAGDVGDRVQRPRLTQPDLYAQLARSHGAVLSSACRCRSTSASSSLFRPPQPASHDDPDR